jgi:hypothetical protein
MLSSAVECDDAPLARLDEPRPAPAPPPAEPPRPEPRDEAPEHARPSRREAPFPAADSMARGPDEPPRVPRLPMPSAYGARAAEPPQKRRSARVMVPVLFGAAGIALAVGARWMRESAAPAPLPPAIGEAQPSAEPPVEPAATPGSVPAKPEELPEELPLGNEDRARLRKGQGLLEIVAGREDVIHVDGKEVGTGPVLKLPVTASDEPHEVRVKMRGEERVRYVSVKEATRVRLRIAPPWSR